MLPRCFHPVRVELAMRQTAALLLLASLSYGCSRGTDQPAESSAVAAAAAPGAEIETSTSTGADTADASQAAIADPRAEAAQRELELAIEIARLTRGADKHEQRGYFDQAVEDRLKTLELIERRYGSDAWQTRMRGWPRSAPHNCNS